jgi:hypothetical protein
MPEAFNVFDAQLVAQQRLQAAGMITTLVSSKEVGSTYVPAVRDDCCSTTRLPEHSVAC